METFMDRLYTRISNGQSQQYTQVPPQKRSVIDNGKLEKLISVIHESDSKQLECIAAMLEQESEERRQSAEEILSALQNNTNLVREMKTEQSYQPEPVQTIMPESLSFSIPEEQLKELEEHVHKENVKCYRNVQAAVVEQAGLQIEQTRSSTAPLFGLMITVLVLSLAQTALLVAHILGYI